MRAVAWTSDGAEIMSGSRDGTLFIFDAETGEPVMVIKKCGSVSLLATSPSFPQFVVGNQESGKVRTLTLFNILNYNNAEDVCRVCYWERGRGRGREGMNVATTP